MIINGTSGQDNLEAKKNDQLFGFEGDDILDASNGQGSNLLDGGSGNDKLVGNNQDTLKGGAGTDSLYALGSSGFNTLEGGEDNDQLFVVEGGNNILSGESGNDTLTVSGGSGSNTLNGGIGNDKLDVSNLTGNNILNGNEGDDILVGGLGSDQLFGGSGDDLLFGGVKGSKLTGGTGVDKFYLASAAIPEVAIEVLDFTQGEDKIIIEGIPEIANFANLILTQTGSDTTVKANIGSSVKSLGILKNIQANILRANDFNFNDDSAPNKKPTLQNFTQNGQEDQIISFGIGDFKDKGKYQDEDNNDLIAIKVISLPTTGSLTFVNGQQVTVNQEISVNDLANVRYNPVANANGNVATFTIAAIDNGTPKAESDPATITINLTPVNDPPIAQNDQLSVSQGSLGTINPLNNDSDPDGDNLKIAGKTDGKYGKVDINGNNLTYTLLDANYLGNDVFSYTVSDGSLSASANVRVTVTAKAASVTVAPTQLISIAPGDKLIPQEAGALTGIVDKLAYRFSDYNPSLVKNSLQNALNQTSAAFNNLFGLYEVDDETGAVNGIKPGESGYAKAALSKVVDNFIVRVGGLSSGAASDVVVTRGKIYSPFAIANGGNFSGNIQQAINAFLAANPNNSPANAQNYTTLPVAYFSFGVANPDGAAHLKSFGNNTFGFEDLPAGVGVSDYDFNDTMFSFGGIA
ncbi:MAG: Ig-like domain-containing protein [Anabaena sp. CoA2_C59]|nr:Ig-like domain-containing protein [Anabaena sp. CoA2_C59]MDJ0505597.1 Ig-like domain-containing protein [Nostocales cyanobacterium LE14-WE12]